MNTPWLVLGLGNPGPQYAGNRHNVGAMVLDVIAAELGAGFRQHKARAMVAQARYGVGVDAPAVVLAKPMSYMNLSGGPTAGLASFFGIPADRVVVVHDELDVDFGVLKLKTGGGEGGHNGLRDISKALGTRDYTRVRVGVGRPPGRMDPADYVLRDFSSTERKELPILLAEAGEAVELIITKGLQAAQLRFHTRG